MASFETFAMFSVTFFYFATYCIKCSNSLCSNRCATYMYFQICYFFLKHILMCVCTDVSYVHKFKCNSFKLFTILIVRFDGIAVALNCSRLDRNTFSKVQNTKTASYIYRKPDTNRERRSSKNASKPHSISQKLHINYIESGRQSIRTFLLHTINCLEHIWRETPQTTNICRMSRTEQK